MRQTFEVTPAQAGQRLDLAVAKQVKDVSRAALQRAINTGLITVNEKRVKPSYCVRAADRISIELPENAAAPAFEVAPDTAMPIIYEDRDVIVIDKPAGVVVHGAPPVPAPTVTAWLRARYPDSNSIGASDRPGVVHRLDKDTSGVLILAKTAAALEHLKQQFARRRVKKTYLALVYGVPGEAKGRVTRPLKRSPRNPLRRTIDPAGKSAITEWRREKTFGAKFALLKVFPLTGRTHQIRAHLHFLGFPLVGDALYTFKRQKPPPGVARQLLHAAELTLTLPSGKRATFTAPLPQDFTAVLDHLTAPSNSSQ